MAPDPAEATQAVMRWSDWIAILGAAAWVPHLVRLFRRPKVSIVVGNQVEIGFTGLGPIFNPTLAFRVQHRDALVTRIAFDVRHEQGQVFSFVGAQLQETSGVTQSPSGEPAFIHQRNQFTIAIVLTPTTIADRKVASSQRSHVRTLDQHMVAYKDAIARVQPGDPDHWYERVRSTAEHAAARTFMRDAFRWQVGSYTVQAEAKIEELRSLATAQFSFTLSSQEVDLLRRNYAGIELELYRVWCEYSGAEQPRINWLWVYRNV